MTRRIASTELRLGMYIQKLGGSWLKHPFLRSSFLLTDADDIKSIVEAGIEDVWIDEEKGEAIQNSHPVTPSKQPAVEDFSDTQIVTKQSIEDKKTVLQTSMEDDINQARKVFHEAKPQVMAMYKDARLGKAIDPQTTLPLVNEIDLMVQRNSAAILSVARLKTHDDYTYMHSLAVCALMISLARQLNLDEEQVKLAGVGGLMHDLGKSLMPLEVLNKPGKLSEAEYNIMKKHPAAGAKLLENSGAAPEVVDIALHHHEKINGLGYPNRLQGEEISLFSRMAAICDVYDAVTSERAYKQAWDPAGTIREMAQWEGHFDKQLFNAFVKMVGIYPVGSLVRLTSQRLAVVIEPGVTSLVKPKVKVFFSLRSKAPIQIQVVDLALLSCKETIEGPEDPSKWHFKHLEQLWQ
ncbi:HD-GYP domain-containing protein [Methylophaga muralis]|uniref:Cyclic di-GMP phosphodiesterase response regulator RpfG n=1 Tax=Methylophaga muralis TaxID=291169 RepID=A0A1E3GQ10_9GAMM|nr:HD-GYP domain-containing protein [Methylophaga muralis]ODN65646.1 Cyclic di-GMP phosphodiesterase response regulator RpfG [Methylophaga muralis]